MPLSDKPTIFIAFANDAPTSEAYLRNLVEEKNAVREALKTLQENNYYDVIYEPHASIDTIFQVFRAHSNIQVFHYGGHSNSYQLLLENFEGKVEVAHSEGLASMLGRQENLKLVFLNGCSSGKIAEKFIANGLPAVIGTKWSINDKVAVLLAKCFYEGLAQGQPIEKAFKDTTDQIDTKHGTANLRDLYWEGNEETEMVGKPWELYEQGNGGNWALKLKEQPNLQEQEGKKQVIQQADKIYNIKNANNSTFN
jgi:CHAT domain-containing protein